MNQIVLVVGASGGIGQAVVNHLAVQADIDKVYALSRRAISHENSKVVSQDIDYSDAAIKAFIQTLKQSGESLAQVYICTGVLHDGDTLQPEKRLEDIEADALTHYFAVNTIIPALWLKHLVKIMRKQNSSIGLISARVGSISDNRLGGWYGYRSSKAALNMMIKSAAIEYARRAKTTCLISYHPGTVDTALSEPFQANVKPEKLFTPQFTAERFVAICQGANSAQSPLYVDYANHTIDW